MSENVYTLSELVRLTGAKRRSIQLWSDAGILRALPETNRAGSGTHRRYRREEAELAAILAPLARMGVSIGNLQGFAQVFRMQPSLEGRDLQASDNAGEVMDRARRGVGRNFLFHVEIPERGSAMQFIRATQQGRISLALPPQVDRAIIIDLNQVWSSLRD